MLISLVPSLFILGFFHKHGCGAAAAACDISNMSSADESLSLSPSLCLFVMTHDDECGEL
jgi:hypothetical protein